MKAYSMDLRERVLADCDGGMEARQVAVKYRVSESWIRRLKQRRRETGETAPRPCRNRQGAKWLAHADRIKELVGCQPDVTLRELAERLGHALSGQTLSRALRALGLTLKKSPARRRAGPARRGAAPPLVAALATGPPRRPHRVPR
jgi:transposase